LTPVPALDVTPDEAQRMTRLWWVAVLLGILSIAAGAIVLSKPDNSLKALAAIAGIFILIDGIVEIVLAVTGATTDRGLAALLGTLNLIIGVVLIRHPIAGVQAAALLGGIWLVAAGAIRLVIAFDHAGDRLGRVILAAIEIGFGILIVSSAHIGFATLAVLVGVSFLANGLGLIAFGILLWTIKRRGPLQPDLVVAA
jgi:uncharacterized membrane protein HdeD (DUF308 family)